MSSSDSIHSKSKRRRSKKKKARSTPEPKVVEPLKLGTEGERFRQMLRKAADITDEAAKAAAVIHAELVEEYTQDAEKRGEEAGPVPEENFDFKKDEFQTLVASLVQIRMQRQLIKELGLGEYEREIMSALIDRSLRPQRSAIVRRVPSDHDVPPFYGSEEDFLKFMLKMKAQRNLLG